MIAGYATAEGKLRPLSDVAAEKEAAVWVDLLRPTEAEEKSLEAALGVEIPTREEMNEIEVSSRLYMEDDIAFMTAMVLSHADGDDAVISPVTFVLAGSRLLTIRYEEPRAFAAFPARAQKAQLGCVSAETILVGLLEAIVDRLADVLERATHDTDRLSHEIFQMHGAKPTKSRDFQKTLVELGRKGDLASKIRDSLVTLARLFGFLALHSAQGKTDKELKARIKTLSRDAGSLSDHVSYMSQKITFLLDATLGMINIEQNAIIKIFSVAAVAFLPPTLIASIYGMNFHNMPELASPYGYPIVIGLMILSAVLPLAYFKRRGWL
ncbi:MAG: magnesium/cobalt transporter CorA [Pseudomonadota bacterium]|nr:magnesium/cobalt transporter CorA [Pseudomonadota bacterium]